MNITQQRKNEKLFCYIWALFEFPNPLVKYKIRLFKISRRVFNVEFFQQGLILSEKQTSDSYIGRDFFSQFFFREQS